MHSTVSRFSRECSSTFWRVKGFLCLARNRTTEIDAAYRASRTSPVRNSVRPNHLFGRKCDLNHSICGIKKTNGCQESFLILSRLGVVAAPRNGHGRALICSLRTGAALPKLNL